MMNRIIRNAIAIGLCAGFQLPVHAIDSASLDLAEGNKTQVIRVSAQWDWSSRWWQSNGTHLSGYWDLGLGQWRATRFGNTDSVRTLTDLGLTPVFRWERNDRRGWYGELGIGVHYLSGRYDNNGRQLSTHFQFGDHLGVGYVFGGGVDLGLRLQHFSNGGYREPNDGVNMAVLRARYRF
jgi:lipid A 3-O-deacylase